jgi:hypothetical protein
MSRVIHEEKITGVPRMIAESTEIQRGRTLTHPRTRNNTTKKTLPRMIYISRYFVERMSFLMHDSLGILTCFILNYAFRPGE